MKAIASASRGLFCNGIACRLDLLGGRFGQLGPNAAPGFLTQHLARQCAVAFALNPPGLNRPHVAATSKALVQIFIAGVEFLRPKTPLFCRNFILHSAMLAQRYLYRKRYATRTTHILLKLWQ